MTEQTEIEQLRAEVARLRAAYEQAAARQFLPDEGLIGDGKAILIFAIVFILLFLGIYNMVY